MRLRKLERSKEELVSAWACGGGVQSTAIAALIVQGKLPKPDYAYMVDCGWEKTRTRHYVQSVLIPNLSKAGVDLKILKTPRPSPVKDNRCLLPGYKLEDGKVKKLHTRCSGQWKRRVAMRWLREQGVNLCENWIGISTDEGRRNKPSDAKWLRHKYPLLELGLSRADCLSLIAWSEPKHTSCLMCPHQTDEQWTELQAEWPVDFIRAVRVEREIQEQCGDNHFLHWSCKPLDKVFRGGGVKSLGRQAP